MYFVYILQSVKNNRSYTGVTQKDPNIRLSEHNSGTNQWTKENRPFKLVYYESYFCQRDALHREKFLKSGVGRGLVKLITENYSVSAKG